MVPGRHTTYSFAVDDFYTYFVGTAGVWVHNTSTAVCQRAFRLIQDYKNRLGLDDVAAFERLRQGWPSARAETLGDVVTELVLERNQNLGLTDVWTKGRARHAGKNLWEDHWLKHQPEYIGRIDNAIEYVERAFSPASRQASDARFIVGWKSRADGTWDKVIMDIATGDFVTKSTFGQDARKL